MSFTEYKKEIIGKRNREVMLHISDALEPTFILFVNGLEFWRGKGYADALNQYKEAIKWEKLSDDVLNS